MAALQAIQVIDPVPLYDTGSFEHFQRVASVMARCSLIPDALRVTKVVDEDGKPIKENGKAVMEPLAPDVIVANCFLVVNQAARWGMDPFAVAQCVSVVGGKLCYEGKLVAGVLDAKLGIELDYHYNDKAGDALGVVVKGIVNGKEKEVDGTVGGWKTTRYGSPWSNPAQHKSMLAYRGAREWARRHKPSIMLGVYTPDELEDLSEGRSSQFRGITPVDPGIGRREEPKQIEASGAVAMPVIKEGESVPVQSAGQAAVKEGGAGSTAGQPDSAPRPPSEHSAAASAPSAVSEVAADSPGLVPGQEPAAASEQQNATGSSGDGRITGPELLAPTGERGLGRGTESTSRETTIESAPSLLPEGTALGADDARATPESASASLSSPTMPRSLGETAGEISSPSSPERPPFPTDDASYYAWVVHWARYEATSRKDAMERWLKEKPVRDKLAVDMNTTIKSCRAFLEEWWPKGAGDGRV